MSDIPGATLEEGIALPAILDLQQVEPLKQALLQAYGAGRPIVVDALAVQRASSLCLQLLVAARQDAESPGLRFSGSSQTFTDIASGLGLAEALGLTENSDD